MERQEVSIKFEKALDIWQKLCSLHNDLFQKTCDEYLSLLSSDLDELEHIIQDKEEIIQEIDQIDHNRKQLIKTLNASNGINSVSQLINYFDSNNVDAKNLNKLNLLLIDIIEKITDQNKKNQLFLNKAINSINELKSSFKGQSQYKLYSNRGQITTKNV